MVFRGLRLDSMKDIVIELSCDLGLLANLSYAIKNMLSSIKTLKVSCTGP